VGAAFARGIENVPGVKQAGVRVGNWLVREQASELLNALDLATDGAAAKRFSGYEKDPLTKPRPHLRDERLSYGLPI